MDQEKACRQFQSTSEKTRRIVELNTFGDQLIWFHFCQLPLSINNGVKEGVHGLATIFTIQCMKLNQFFQVRTDTSDDSRTFPVNSKVAFDMIDSGLGETHINSLFSSFNIPTVTTSLLKRHERMIGPALEAIAQESCVESIELEKKLTLSVMKNKKQVLTKKLTTSIVYM